jgi:hypothetical protein
MYWKPDRLTLVRQRPFDRLLDPPSTVRTQLVTLCRVKMDVSESSPAIHQLRRRPAQKPQLSPVTVTWLATGVLGTVVFAALGLAGQERQPNANDLTEQRQAEVTFW